MCWGISEICPLAYSLKRESKIRWHLGQEIYLTDFDMLFLKLLENKVGEVKQNCTENPQLNLANLQDMQAPSSSFWVNRLVKQCIFLLHWRPNSLLKDQFSGRKSKIQRDIGHLEGKKMWALCSLNCWKAFLKFEWMDGFLSGGRLCKMMTCHQIIHTQLP